MPRVALHPAELALEIALTRLRAGELTLVRHDGSERHYAGPESGPAARVELASPAAAWRTVLGGATGMAEAYVDGQWDTPDLDAVLLLGATHYAHVPSTYRSPKGPVARAFHASKDNTLRGSRDNIAAHYDLGNEFYRLWLDDTMTYSSALFSRGDEALEQAQVRKWDRLLEILQPSRKDHLLEVGCGWGGFAAHAAREAGCRVTALTISDEQFAWARDAVEKQGLEGQVEIRLQDYRETQERFSGIVSIEMFEAVGEKWWPVFFRRLKDLLEPGRVAALQTITIEERRFEDYRDHPDFIQRHIFPGGMLPSPERFARCAASAGLAVHDEKFFGESYALTLSEWARRFEAARTQLLAMGYDERFLRLWRYYLSYCRAGFSAGTIDVMQVRLQA